MAMPPAGSKVTVTYCDTTTTATLVGLIGAGSGRANVAVRLDGTDQLVTVPMAWIEERI
jgi:hypothetical protein